MPVTILYYAVSKDPTLRPIKDQLDNLRPNKKRPGYRDAIAEEKFEQLKEQLLPPSQQPESPALQGPK